jgi:hypothetical protein
MNQDKLIEKINDSILEVRAARVVGEACLGLSKAGIELDRRTVAGASLYMVLYDE